jgi:hypothetical protein
MKKVCVWVAARAHFAHKSQLGGGLLGKKTGYCGKQRTTRHLFAQEWLDLLASVTYHGGTVGDRTVSLDQQASLARVNLKAAGTGSPQNRGWKGSSTRAESEGLSRVSTLTATGPSVTWPRSADHITVLVTSITPTGSRIFELYHFSLPSCCLLCILVSDSSRALHVLNRMRALLYPPSRADSDVNYSMLVQRSILVADSRR